MDRPPLGTKAAVDLRLAMHFLLIPSLLFTLASA